MEEEKERGIKNSNFIAIQGWMLNELKLKGNELIVYACIFGISQAESQKYTGSLQYLADWTNSTKQGVIKVLKSLVEKGYIIKEEHEINKVKFCEYYSTKFNGGIQQSLMGGIKQSLPNNIDINNIYNNIKKESKKENGSEMGETVKGEARDKGNSFDSLIEKYSHSPEETNILKEWLKVRKSKRGAMTDTAIELNLKKLDDFARWSGLTVVEYIEEVVRRGWVAFYEINKNYGGGNNNGDFKYADGSMYD